MHGRSTHNYFIGAFLLTLSAGCQENVNAEAPQADAAEAERLRMPRWVRELRLRDACDGVDNDNDGIVDNAWPDSDKDGLMDCVDRNLCVDASGRSCDGPEVCDGFDNDNDGAADEGFDADADGVGNCLDVESCDRIDNNGDGLVDEGAVCPADDGLCASVVDAACVTLAEATALGWLTVASAPGAGTVVNLTNHGTRAICLDEAAMFTSPTSQTLVLDEAVLGATVEAGATLAVYYGSWTTANDTFELYLGRPAWWSLEMTQYAAANATYELAGERVPAVLSAVLAPGLASRDVWAGTYGVRANYDAWDIQATRLVPSLGKTAEDTGDGVLVELTARNLGAVGGATTVTDTVPAGWAPVGLPEGFSAVSQPDGTTRVSGVLTLAGTPNGFNPPATRLSYRLVATTRADAPRLELGAATLIYSDAGVQRATTSLDATVFTVDVDQNGFVDCR